MRSLAKCVLAGSALLLLCSAGPLAAQQKACGNGKTAPDTVMLSGAAIGSVKFIHVTHEKMTQCVNCHHASKPEKPLVSAHQKCSECHTKTAVAPMKTNSRDAYHNATAKTGTCMDCHIKRGATRQGVPVTCNGCHRRGTT